MSLEIILGSMFSGKSSHLISIIKKYKAISWSTFVITHSFDNRYSQDATVVSHNQESVIANCKTDKLYSVINDTNFNEAKVIIIEEAQFFDSLVEFVVWCVEVLGKTVIVAGLDGDSNRKPFGSLLQLIPYADTITKLKSFCSDCGDGTSSLFSSKKIISKHTVDVGSSDKYEPLCRKHYLIKN